MFPTNLPVITHVPVGDVSVRYTLEDAGFPAAFMNAIVYERANDKKESPRHYMHS